MTRHITWWPCPLLTQTNGQPCKMRDLGGQRQGRSRLSASTTTPTHDVVPDSLIAARTPARVAVNMTYQRIAIGMTEYASRAKMPMAPNIDSPELGLCFHPCTNFQSLCPVRGPNSLWFVIDWPAGVILVAICQRSRIIGTPQHGMEFRSSRLVAG
jgi:hypothetical protein